MVCMSLKLQNLSTNSIYTLTKGQQVFSQLLQKYILLISVVWYYFMLRCLCYMTTIDHFLLYKASRSKINCYLNIFFYIWSLVPLCQALQIQVYIAKHCGFRGCIELLINLDVIVLYYTQNSDSKAYTIIKYYF